jgi:hypothetical protein
MFESDMTRTFNPVYYNAFAELMAQPDPADLPRRAHVCRCEGDPNRRATRFPGILMGWLQRHYLDIDVEEPVASATHMPIRLARPANPGLRLLRPTGTG